LEKGRGDGRPFKAVLLGKGFAHRATVCIEGIGKGWRGRE